jgi:type VI protein secretion system component VasF
MVEDRRRSGRTQPARPHVTTRSAQQAFGYPGLAAMTPARDAYEPLIHSVRGRARFQTRSQSAIAAGRSLDMKQRWSVLIYRALELAVVVVTYLVLAMILYRAVTWLFGAHD